MNEIKYPDIRRVQLWWKESTNHLLIAYPINSFLNDKFHNKEQKNFINKNFCFVEDREDWMSDFSEKIEKSRMHEESFQFLGYL